MEERICKVIIVPIEIWKDENLSWNEKILFLEINSFTSKNKDCFISNEYIAKLLKVTETTANKVLSSLIKKGYVIKTKFDGRRRFVKTAFSFNRYDTSEQGCSNEQGRLALLDNIPNTYTNDIITKEYKDKSLYKKKRNVKAKVNWRGDYDIYLQECKKAFDEVVRDAECEKSLMVSYPNIDYYRTVLKSYEFWKSERGWDYKKRGTSVSINMASTLKRNLEKNIVYENPNNVHIENKLKLTLKIVDDKGTLEDGTLFKNGYRYYKSGNGKEYSVPVTAPARPDERWEYSIDNGWYLPESKETLDDLLW